VIIQGLFIGVVIDVISHVLQAWMGDGKVWVLVPLFMWILLLFISFGNN